jgi:DNA processing protein
LQAIPGIGPKIADNIRSFSSWKVIEEQIDHAEKIGAEIITYNDPRYPQNLLNTYDYPPFLYVRGSLLPNELCVALVGSRLASVYGRFTTEKLGRELALKGITIVSGLARGIDSAAHRGALAARGRTIAVLGTGIDIVYPLENEGLAAEIVKNGALVSEFPLGTPPNAPNFPARNRIISGISVGVVVVEAGAKSGSLITARIAAEQGRSVFAVPGEIAAAGSKGTNHLIRQGATLIESVDDILEELSPQISAYQAVEKGNPVSAEPKRQSASDDAEALAPRSTPEKTLTKEEKTLFSLLSSGPTDIDTLVEKSRMSAGVVQGALLTLELGGLIKRLPGKQFSLKE